MPKRIACLLGTNGETASFYEEGKIVIYQKDLHNWHIINEKEHKNQKIDNMKELRLKMDDIINFIGDCKIFVAQSVVGIPFYMLEKANCSVWECQGRPEDFLDDIVTEEELDSQLPEGNKILLDKYKPVEIGKGQYQIFIKEVQEQSLGITSKQVALPFLKKGNFRRLEVFCNHIPHWLETEVLIRKYVMQVEQIEQNNIKVTISKG